MENQLTPNNITPQALLKRQLDDWRQLRQELTEKGVKLPSHELYNQIAYCENKVRALQTELDAFTSDPSNQ